MGDSGRIGVEREWNGWVNRFRDCINDPSDDRNAIDPVDPIDTIIEYGRNMAWIAESGGSQVRLFCTVETDQDTDPS